jgi:hypothetical protein
VLLLVQLPPVDAVVYNVADPAQTTGDPLMADGKGLTTTIAVLKQPVGKV